MFEEIRAFVAVAETKSFTKAARRVSFSQPTVSQQVKRMELYFNGTLLIDRMSSGANVKLTPEGVIVYKRCKEILDILDKTVHEISPHELIQMTHLRIGASRTVGSNMLPVILKKFSEVRPDVITTITVDNTQQICRLLHDKEIDIGLIEGKDISYSFIRKDFFKDELILAAAPSVAGELPDFGTSCLNRLTWIIREIGSGTRQYQKDFFTSSGIRALHQIECNSNSANIELARQGMGITLISLISVLDDIKSNRLVQIPSDRKMYRSFSYILNSDKAHPVMQDFLTILDKISQWEA